MAITYLLSDESRVALVEETFPETNITFFNVKSPKAMQKLMSDKGLINAKRVIVILEELQASPEFYISQLKTLNSHVYAKLIIGISDMSGADIILGARERYQISLFFFCSWQQPLGYY